MIENLPIDLDKLRLSFGYRLALAEIWLRLEALWLFGEIWQLPASHLAADMDLSESIYLASFSPQQYPAVVV